MNWRDELSEEMGYTICPLSCYTYVYCDKECTSCLLYNDFIESLQSR